MLVQLERCTGERQLDGVNANLNTQAPELGPPAPADAVADWVTVAEQVRDLQPRSHALPFAAGTKPLECLAGLFL